MQTDNGAELQAHFHWHLEQLDIRHVYIRPWTPRLNGNVERSHRVGNEEFYQLLDKGLPAIQRLLAARPGRRTRRDCDTP